MKKLLASLKLIKEHYMYMVTLVCLDCGDSSQMVEVEIFRGQAGRCRGSESVHGWGV